jgi:hypothetical protein
MWDQNLSDAQRDRLRGQFRQQMESMTEAQRRAFFNANRDQWQQRSVQRMNEFFAMSKVDQMKRLDEIINRAAQQKNPRPQNANQRNGGGRAMSEAQREERSKRRLDSSSPKLRAQYTEFRKMLDKRASERGVKMDNNWGRGGGFGGGRG